jgi:hypothetical protein
MKIIQQHMDKKRQKQQEYTEKNYKILYNSQKNKMVKQYQSKSLQFFYLYEFLNFFFLLIIYILFVCYLDVL